MEKEYHLADQPIPVGFRLYEDRLAIAGLQYRRSHAINFCQSTDQNLLFERDSENEHDQNAIKIYGCWQGFFWTKKKFLGYVPREIAAQLVATEVEPFVRPRLLKTYLGDDGYVEVLFQIVGPKEYFPRYKPRIEKSSM